MPKNEFTFTTTKFDFIFEDLVHTGESNYKCILSTSFVIFLFISFEFNFE